MFAMPVTTFMRDLYLTTIKNYTGPTMVLEEAKRQSGQQEDVKEASNQLPLSQPRVTRESSKSI